TRRSSDLEQPPAIGRPFDLQRNAAGIDRVAAHLGTPAKGAVVPAPGPGPERPAIIAAPVRTIAVPRTPPRVVEPGRADPLAAVVDAVVEADDQVGGGRVVDRGVAERSEVVGDQLGVLAELDASLQLGVLGDDREGL